MAYATVDDLALVMGEEIGAADQPRAEKLLDMAAEYIDDHCDSSKVSPGTLGRISTNLVRRVWDIRPAGVSQSTISGGPYSQSFTYVGNNNGFYLTRSEKQDLGIYHWAAGCVKVDIHDADGASIEW